jgi:hypothetical protein
MAVCGSVSSWFFSWAPTGYIYFVAQALQAGRTPALSPTTPYSDMTTHWPTREVVFSTFDPPALIIIPIILASFTGVFLLVYLPVWIVTRRENRRAQIAADCEQASQIDHRFSCKGSDDDDRASAMTVVEPQFYGQFCAVLPSDAVHPTQQHDIALTAHSPKSHRV